MQQKSMKTRASAASTNVPVARNRVFSVECLEDPPILDDFSETAPGVTPSQIPAVTTTKVTTQFDPVTVGDYIVLRSADSFATGNFLCGDAAWMRVGSQFQQVVSI